MPKSLLIVESPAKAKTINKYLGKDFIVEASVGHIKNLPKSKIGVDVENNFESVYDLIPGKEEILNKLRTHATTATTVYIATDPDREGEAIAMDIADEIKSINKNIFRILFHEITKDGINEGMSNPLQINEKLVDSQRARRAMDRLVGYKVSPFIWKTVFYGLSAGRVQSVALRLICEREEEIKRFNPKEYWSLTADFKTKSEESFYAKLVKISGKDPKINNEKAANDILKKLSNQTFDVSAILKKETKRTPPAPFITSTLQQEASSRLRLSSKRTMMLAQKLYEGIDLGDEGSVGLITYMRTDSTRISDDAVKSVRKYIYENYGKEYVPHEARIFKKGKTSQDAHEAIRPTSIKYTPKFVKKFLDREMYQVYSLIWNRFVACQMSVATFDQVTIEITASEFLFRTTGTTPLFRGFLQVYDDMIEEKDFNEDEDPISPIPKKINQGENVLLNQFLPRQHFTKPPARFSESTLVKELETLGIGRPSTYAQIVSTILYRNYIELIDRRLFATSLGMLVSKILTKSFPDIFNVDFTRLMEDELETIASGDNKYLTVLNDFWKPFSHTLENANKESLGIKKSLIEETDTKCKECGKMMVKKWGRNGQFMACKGYPNCKNTSPLPEDLEKQKHVEGVMCRECNAQMVTKSSKFGLFLGCSNYPTCSYTQPMTIGINCPTCKDGHVIERKTKRKRNFYGCSRYPECNFASWNKPKAEPCKECKNPYVEEKYSAKKGNHTQCPVCKYVEILDDILAEE